MGIIDLHISREGIAPSADSETLERLVLAESPFEHFSVYSFILVFNMQRVPEVYIRVDKIVQDKRLQRCLAVFARRILDLYSVIVALLVITCVRSQWRLKGVGIGA